MMISRRNFLRFSAAAATVIRCALPEASAANTFEPSPFDQNSGLIRLNSNENAYGPSVAVTKAIESAVGSSNRYPRMQYEALAERIANAHKVKPEQVLLGCGSTEILRAAACAFLGTSRQLVQAWPTFEAIGYYAGVAGAKVASVPLTSAFAHDLDGMLMQARASPGVVYICNPNNPTASLTPRKDLETFIGKLPPSTFVVMDEAYHHYAGHSVMYASFIDRPLDDSRVIGVRTFSKIYGLAGLRLGYAIGSPGTIQQMRKFVTQDNVNAIATQAAAAALDDTEGVHDSVQRNANDLQEFFNQAMARSLKPIDSHANFVMMNTFQPAEQVIHQFRKNNILIGRRFQPMETYIRVSLGLPQEMLAFWKTWDSLPHANVVMHH
jgi:histidinol-phosphate aminotransferase